MLTEIVSRAHLFMTTSEELRQRARKLRSKTAFATSPIDWDLAVRAADEIEALHQENERLKRILMEWPGKVCTDAALEQWIEESNEVLKTG